MKTGTCLQDDDFLPFSFKKCGLGSPIGKPHAMIRSCGFGSAGQAERTSNRCCNLCSTSRLHISVVRCRRNQNSHVHNQSREARRARAENSRYLNCHSGVGPRICTCMQCVLTGLTAGPGEGRRDRCMCAAWPWFLH